MHRLRKDDESHLAGVADSFQDNESCGDFSVAHDLVGSWIAWLEKPDTSLGIAPPGCLVCVVKRPGAIIDMEVDNAGNVGKHFGKRLCSTAGPRDSEDPRDPTPPVHQPLKKERFGVRQPARGNIDEGLGRLGAPRHYPFGRAVVRYVSKRPLCDVDDIQIGFPE